MSFHHQPKKASNMSQKIMVIGSNSFSGAHFVAHALACGANVTGVSRSPEPSRVFLPYKWMDKTHNFAFFQYDLNHHLDEIMALVQDVKPDFLVNFAAQSMVGQSWDTPGDWFRTNVLSTVLFHDALRRCPFIKKYVHVSTPEVYGSCEGLVKEDNAFNPSTPYAVSRAAADMSLMTFFKQYDFPVVFTRAANVYGPGQQLYRIIPRTVLFFRTGRTLHLHGGGVSVRSFIHIKDVVKGTMDAMEKGRPGEIYHFSTRQNISIRALVAYIAKLMAVPFDDHVETASERPGKDAAYLLDASKAKNELGWSDTIGLGAGIRGVMAWVDENRKVLTQQPLDYVHRP